MPFDSNGNSTVTRNRAITGQTVQAAQVNVPFDDIQSMLSQVLLRSGVAPMTGPLNMNGFKVTGAADGIASSDLATVGQLQNAAPIGSVISYAGLFPPAGWMLCYGQALSRTQYAALFAVIGDAFGSGNGSTTFNLPDCRGRVEAGKDDMGGTDAGRLSVFGSLARSIAGTFGAAVHILTAGQLASHTHGVNDPSHAHPGVQNSNASQGRGDQSPGVAQYSFGSTFPALTGITIQNSGNNEPHNNTQPTIIFNKIIKVS